MGGAIFNLYGAVTITNSTLTGNAALGGAGQRGGTGGVGGDGLGGAVFNLDGTVTARNATLDSNTVTAGPGDKGSGSAAGGAVYNLALGNNPQTGSAISATLTLANSILADSTGGVDLVNNAVNGNGTNTATVDFSAPDIVSSSDLSAGTTVGTIFNTADPKLGPLANNGGPTQTMALRPGSPAVGTGAHELAVDQRGLPRPVARPDLGAFEVQLVDVTGVTSTNPNGAYKAGKTITIDVTFSAAVTVTGTPQLTLDTGKVDAVADYTGGSGTDTLTFTFTVAHGEQTPDLDYTSATALALNGGTITDTYGFAAVVTLPAPGSAHSLGANKHIVINTSAPNLTIPIFSFSSSTSASTLAEPIVFAFQFSEDVTGFTANAITLTGGTAGTFTAVNEHSYTLAVTPNGPGTVTVGVAAGAAQDIAGNGNTAASASVTVPPPPPPAVAYYAVGAGVGSSQVTVFDATGTPVNSFFAFPGFDGGVTVASTNANGTPEVVVGTATANSAVKVFDALTGAVLFSTIAFPGFDGGVTVAAGDTTGTGTPDIIVGTAIANSAVKVFDGGTGAEFQSFFAFPGFEGGITVGAGDVYHSGHTDIIVGTAVGGSVVGVFDGRTAAPVTQFQAFADYTGGVNVSVGDLSGSGFAEILVGANADGVVKALDGNGNTLQSSFAYPGFSGAVRVGSVAVGGHTELLTGVGPGGPPQVEQFGDPPAAPMQNSLALMQSFNAFEPGYIGGVYIG
jgi:hypothetical protein